MGSGRRRRPATQPDRPWNGLQRALERTVTSRCTPCAISLAVSHKMLAIAYSRQPITLWDLEGDSYYGCCRKKLASGETSIVHMRSLRSFSTSTQTLASSLRLTSMASSYSLIRSMIRSWRVSARIALRSRPAWTDGCLQAALGVEQCRFTNLTP